MAKTPKRRPGARAPFDPSKMRAPASLFESHEHADEGAGADPSGSPPAAPAHPKPPKGAGAGRDDRYTVTQLAALINGALRAGLPARVSVVGEISGFKDQTHWWFRLKDAGAVIECVMFASAARKHRSAPRDGDEVVARGRVEHYPKQGRTQLYVDRIEPIGAGALEQQFRALCAEIKALGWFDPERKQPLPRFPRRVAVVTSRTSAAVQDVIDTFRRRAPFIPILLVDVRVQGAQAAGEIARAIERVGRERERLGVDAILLTRGGGSIEDLWAFNERAVAEAIVRSPVPIVAAIGHETDTTIAELVADERAATPTQAAMRLAPDRAALLEQVEQLDARSRAMIGRLLDHQRERLRGLSRAPFLRDPRSLLQRRRESLAAAVRAGRAAIDGRLHRARSRVSSASARLARLRPEVALAERRARVREAERRLAGSVRVLVLRRREVMRGLARTLDATGPMNVLRRGYSVTTRADGRVVRGAGDAAEGDLIITRLADGQLLSTVGDHTPGSSSHATEPDSPHGLFQR